MSTKPNQLMAAMRAVQGTNQPSAPELRVVGEGVKSAKAASRLGKRVISGHFDPAVSKQLRALANERDSNVQAMLGEALNDLFQKYSKSRIA